MRSPGSITWSPRGSVIESPRMMLATFESAGRCASRSGTPTTPAPPPSSTSNSTICTSPSANTSVWRAALTPITRVIACAVSSSDETTKSRSRRPSRQRSMYSTFDVLMTVVASGASRRANDPATRFVSSRDVQAMTRSARPRPASASARRLAPFASTVATSKRYASGVRRAPSRSTTVISCSAWSASTIVDPTWPAPMMKILTRRAGYTRRRADERLAHARRVESPAVRGCHPWPVTPPVRRRRGRANGYERQ